jgi:hypothetical protein
MAFLYFANHPCSFAMQLWGRTVVSTDLPWFYVPAQLGARLPEGFLALLLAGCIFSFFDCAALVEAFRGGAVRSTVLLVKNAALFVADARVRLTLWAALLLPMGSIIVAHSTLYDGVRHVLFLVPLLAAVGGYGLIRLLPILERCWLPATVLGGAYVGLVVWNLGALHPLEYIAMNSLAGGVRGAYGRFDLDYWASAAAVAARRLEHRLDYEPPSGAFASRLPSITICMGYREALVAPLLRRPWRIEVDPAKADYVVATERWPCADDLRNLVLIDEVKRFGRSFAWVYARRPSDSGDSQSQSTID